MDKGQGQISARGKVRPPMLGHMSGPLVSKNCGFHEGPSQPVIDGEINCEIKHKNSSRRRQLRDASMEPHKSWEFDKICLVVVYHTFPANKRTLHLVLVQNINTYANRTHNI